MAQALTRGDARAPRSSARGDGVSDGAPRESCGERGDRHTFVVVSRFFGPRRASRARVDVGSNGRGPSLRLLKAPARRAHGAVGVLHPPGCPISQITATTYGTRRRKALEGQHIGTEILDDTSIHSSEAPPQTLSNGDRNKLSCRAQMT